MKVIKPKTISGEHCVQMLYMTSQDLHRIYNRANKGNQERDCGYGVGVWVGAEGMRVRV